MATFDKLVHEIDSRYCLGPKASPLVQETLRMISGQPGGISGFVIRLKAAGFAVEVASWLEGSDPVPLSGEEVEQTLGSDVVSGIANKIGVSQRFARTVLGYAIPKIVVLKAQGGAVRSAIRSWASRFFDSATPLSSSRAEEITQHGVEQIQPSRTEHGGAAPVLGELIIPTATLLITLALLLGYFIGTGDRGVIQSTPIVAQNAPAPSSHRPSIPARMPLSNENYAFATIAGSSATVTATALARAPRRGRYSFKRLDRSSRKAKSFRDMSKRGLFGITDFHAAKPEKTSFG